MRDRNRALIKPLLAMCTTIVAAVIVTYLGGWLLGLLVVGLGLIAMVTAFARPNGLVAVLGMIGGLMGVGSATHALLVVGADPIYSQRVSLGWLALALAGAAGGVGLLVPTHRVIMALGILINAVLGTAAMYAFWINTFYILAVPFWLAEALGLAIGSHAESEIKSQ
jgi:hypothetical protein